MMTIRKKYQRFTTSVFSGNSAFIFSFLFCLFSCVGVWGQGVPRNPNKADSKGRQGKWTILYDKNWKVIGKSSKTTFYRIITYKDDVPVGKVRDYYYSGKLQWEGKLLRDRPKDVMNGKCIWYNEGGKVEEVQWFEDGRLVKNKAGNKKGISVSLEQGFEYLKYRKYSKALNVFEQHQKYLEKSFRDHPKSLHIFFSALLDCYEKTRQFEKIKKTTLVLEELEERLGDFWQFMSKGGIRAFRNGDYRKAEKIFVKARLQAEKEFGKEHKNYAIACADLGNLYTKQGGYLQAKNLYVEAKRIYKTKGKKGLLGYCDICNGLGNMYYSQGSYPTAMKYYLESKKILENVGAKNEGYAHICNNLGMLYKALGEFDKAELFIKRSKSITLKVLGNESISYAKSCFNLASLYSDQGLYKKAFVLYQESRSIYINLLGAVHPEHASFYNGLGEFYKRQGLHKKALSFFMQSKLIYAKNSGHNHPNYANSCNNIASLYHSIGLYPDAERLYLEAKGILEIAQGKNPQKYALVCNNLAILYEKQGLYGKARKLFEVSKSLLLGCVGKDHPDYGLSCNNLALLLKRQGFYYDAEFFYLQARSIFKKSFGKNNPRYIASCNNLSELYRLQGAYRKAEAFALEAKNISKISNKNKALYAVSCNNMALLYRKQKAYKKAALLLHEAQNIWVEVFGDRHLNYLLSCNNLAFLYAEQNLYNKANTLFQESFSKAGYQIKQNLSSSSETGRLHFLNANINHYYQSYNSFAESYVKAKGIAKSKKVLAQMYNNRLLTKSLLFHSTQKTKERILGSKDDSLIRMYEQFIVKRRFYSKMLELPIAERKKRGIDLDKLSNEADELEKALARRSKDFAKELEEYVPHSWKEVRQKLRPKEVAIEIIRFRWYDKRWTDTTHYAALIITPKSRFPYPVFLKNGNFLEGKAFQHYAKYKGKDSLSYNQFWQPIQQQLKKLYPETGRIFVSLDGVYHQVNLETLRNPATGKYLGDELDIRLVSNTKDLLKSRSGNGISASGLNGGKKIQTTSETQTAIRLFGFPDYEKLNPKPLYVGGNQVAKRKKSRFELLRPKASPKTKKRLLEFFGSDIPMLAGTRREVKTIQDLLAGQGIASRSFVGKQATEENIKASQHPQVLHLATHGYFLQGKDLDQARKRRQFQLGGTELKQYVENPLLRSGLLWTGAQQSIRDTVYKPIRDSLENGILTAKEVLDMDLDNTDLVVLSACETGRGKVKNGEGVYGLQRAFLSAGAKAVLMSLWKVDDKATSLFMQYFYEEWTKHHKAGKAYRKAQQKLRKRFPAPYYWGAFVLVEG